MEGLANRLPEEVLYIDFLKEAMAKSSARQRILHTLSEHLIAQLPSLQEPCIVKVEFKERYQYEFDGGDTQPWVTEARLCEVIFPEYIDSVFVFCRYRWLKRAPGCKVLMKHCYSGYV
jgi:hypothetical protein